VDGHDRHLVLGRGLVSSTGMLGLARSSRTVIHVGGPSSRPSSVSDDRRGVETTQELLDAWRHGDRAGELAEADDEVRRRRVSEKQAWTQALDPEVTPETRYARIDGLHIAYQTIGEGAVDIVLADQWTSHQEAQWEVAPLAAVRLRLAEIGRLVTFDKRGVGMSDPVSLGSLPSIETWVADVGGVMDAARMDRAVLVTTLGGGLMGLVFAATYPERLRALVVVDGWARARVDADYPIGLTPAEIDRRVEQAASGWGQGTMLDTFAPSMRSVAGLRSAWARYERFAASPGVARAMIANLLDLDVRHVLPAIHVPVLVISRDEAPVFGSAFGRHIADHVEGARFVGLPGIDNLMWAGDQDAIVAAIDDFISGSHAPRTTGRRLATVLFTDIVGSTRHAAEIGDGAWRALLEQHDGLVRRVVQDSGGRVVKGTGDGALATFEAPGRAVDAAAALAVAAPELGIRIRAGLHAGEIELTESDVAGLAVHLAARICAIAAPGEVLVSSTVHDLVVGSGRRFVERGRRTLRGVPGRWRLYAVEG
jgi:class 3 adenylate cyclase